MVMYSQQRNLDKMQDLEKALCRFGEKYEMVQGSRDGNYEGKYRQLKRYLEIYIQNTTQVQEELLEGCRKSKREAERVYREYERVAYVSEELRLKS